MKKYFLGCLLAVSLFVAAGCGDDALILSDNQDTNSFTKQNNDEVDKGYAYICGAVNNPGVYEIRGESRLFEVVEMAGGLDDEADIDSINLAQTVNDGDSVRIPFYGEEHKPEDKVNINKADINELITLPGIGESRALAIIEYREEHGPFKNVEDLMQVTGIKEATFRRIEQYVCAE